MCVYSSCSTSHVFASPCPRSCTVVQLFYAGLDAYASALLYPAIMEHADPVLTRTHPAVQELQPGTSLRLYTRTNSRFVAEGVLVSHGSGDKWGGTTIVIREGRVVTRLTNIHVTAARMLYPNNQGVDSTSLKDARIGELVLWDVVSCLHCAPSDSWVAHVSNFIQSPQPPPE